MTTPAILTNTATTFDRFKVSWPKKAPMKRVNSPEVEDNTVVLATLVRARAALDKYCINQNSKQISLTRVHRGHFFRHIKTIQTVYKRKHTSVTNQIGAR